MNRDRLLTLANYLETVPPEKFDLAIWVEYDKETKCMTAACAVGHACSIPEFISAGLHMEDGYKDVDTCPIPVFGQDAAWNAVYRFFDLTLRDALYLFDECSYMENNERFIEAITPQDVADRIYAFIGDVDEQ